MIEFGSGRMNKSRANIQKFDSEREETAGSSVNQMKRILSQIIHAAIENKHCHSNPTKSKGLSMIKKKKERIGLLRNPLQRLCCKGLPLW